MRRMFIAGNWKMNKSPADAAALAGQLKSTLLDHTSVDIAVAPTALAIPAVISKLKHSNIHVAGQNIHHQTSGAYTGEVSAEMLRSEGCEYVLIGHSERRHKFGETEEDTHHKVQAAFRGGLLPILCVGETLDQRQAGQAAAVTTQQVAAGLASLPADQAAAVTIAYEPVWAIGTGHTASPSQAQEMHAIIRDWLRKNYPLFVSKQIRIQYGGSVKPHNAAALLSQPDVDGALVGGASLQVDSFTAIVEAATAIKKAG